MSILRDSNNTDRFNEILKELKALFPNTTTSVKIVITSEGVRLTEHQRYPEDLAKRSQSMRNIKGEWIK